MNLTHSKSNSKKRRGLSLSSTPRGVQQINQSSCVSGFQTEKIKTDRNVGRPYVNFAYLNAVQKVQVEKKPSVATVIRYQTPRSKNSNPQQNANWQSSGIKPMEINKNVVINNNASNSQNKIQENIEIEKKYQRQFEQNQKMIAQLRQNEKMQLEKISGLYRSLKEAEQKYKAALRQNEKLKETHEYETEKLKKENQALKLTLLQSDSKNNVKNNKQNSNNKSASKRINFQKMNEIESKLNQLILDIKK